jgi:geranylgeranyl reductase family protein
VERFDAIVVGAGPAGSTTAYRLAQGGASVLLLDRARFPRDKPCGGGLTGRALKLLPFPVDPVVEEAAGTFEIRLRYGPRFVRTSAEPLALMTQRSRLDAFLAEQAAAAGADFRDGVRVDEVGADAAGVAVRAGGQTIRGDVLIGADGANGVTAKALGLAREVEHGVALEGNVPHCIARRERYAGRMVVELCVVPGGYGWVFPKGDHVNVGVGGWRTAGPALRVALQRLCAEHGLPWDRVESLRGHRLPLRRAATTLARGRSLVVGDAAGLVDPVSGDGMYEAFLSGKLASDPALDLLAGRRSSLDAYGDEVTRSLARLLSASWGIKSALDRFPRISFAVIRLPSVWRVTEAVMQGDLASPGASGGPARAPIGVLRLLARRAGDPGREYRAVGRLDPTGP